jgi:2,4'-dihydroxyacetophenone dioxygenase
MARGQKRPSGRQTVILSSKTTVLFIRVEGANINFGEDGQFHSIPDTTSIRCLAEAAEAQGVGPLSYIGGGAAGYMTQKA